MKKQRIHGLTMIAGLLLAVAMVLSHVPVVVKKANTVTEVKAGKEQKEKQVLSDNPAPASTLPSVFNVNLNVETYCLFDVATEETPANEDLPEYNFFPQKFLNTLFRVIISPNAP